MSPVTLAQKQVQRSAGAPRSLTAALVVIAFAQLMVVLDTTIVNVALPSIQRTLRFAPTNRVGRQRVRAGLRRPPAPGRTGG